MQAVEKSFHFAPSQCPGRVRRSIWACSLALFVALGVAIPGTSSAIAGKDLGPSGACDSLAKGTSAWTNCVGTAAQGLSDSELFYAGYWMARLGRFDDALAYLNAVKAPDTRTLTYIGFATRKAGDVKGAFPFYRKALALDPDNVVARAYLGEAMLTLGDKVAARQQLEEIAHRCGATCAAYDDLARHIAQAG